MLQVASGRFGVTPQFIMNAEQLEIKIAQGAKPGACFPMSGHQASPLHSVHLAQLPLPQHPHVLAAWQAASGSAHTIQECNTCLCLTTLDHVAPCCV